MKNKNETKWWYGQYADENGTVVNGTRVAAKTKSEAAKLLKKNSWEKHKLVSVEKF